MLKLLVMLMSNTEDFPSTLFKIYTGAWHTAYDQQYMTVNSDGTGGAPSVGGAVGRLVDRSGGGFHLLQPTVGNQPVAKSGYLAFSSISFSGLRRWMQTADASYGGTTQASTGLLIIDVSAFPADSVPFAFTNTNITGAAWPAKQLSLAWRCKPSGYEFWINEIQVTASALASSALGVLFLGASAGNTTIMSKFYESVLITSVITDVEFFALRAYGMSRSGAASFNNTGIVAYGDSRTYGSNSETDSPWINLTTIFPSGRKFNTGVGGSVIITPIISAANLITKYKQSGMTVVGIWIGRNDIDVNGASAAATYAALSAYCRILRSGGLRVAVATEVAITNNTEGLAYSAMIRAGWSGDFAHALADLYSDARLQNRLDTTYFADGTHLTDTGNAVVNGIMSAALASASLGPNPFFSGTPLSGVAPYTVTFTDASTDGPASWLWDFGDGNTSTSQNPTHSYASIGSFDVSLTVTNASGSHTFKKVAYVSATATLAPPSANKVGWYKKGTASGSTWADASGAGNDLTLYNSPTISASSVTFDGINQYGKTAAFTLNQPVTTYIRAKVITYTTSKAIYDGHGALSDLMYMNATTPTISLYSGGGPFAANNDIAVGVFKSVASGKHGTTMFIQASGGSETSSTAAGSNPGGFTLAAQGDGSSRFANIEVIEVIRYAADHTPTERAAALAYLDSL